jgi:hypothetical protein
MAQTLLVHVGLGQSGSTTLFNIFEDAEYGFNLLTPRETREEVMYRLFEGRAAGEYDAQTVRDFFVPKVAQSAPGQIPVISSEGLTRLGFFQSGINLEIEAFAHRLKTTFPDFNVKILLVVREQHRLLRSKYRKYVEKFGGNLPISAFVRAERSRQIVPIDREHQFAGNFAFDKHHSLYSGIFGAENTLTLPMEMLSQEPQCFFNRVYDLCGAPRVTVPASPALNAHGRLSSSAVLRAFNLVYSPLSPSVLGFLNPRVVPDINSLMLPRRTFARAFTKVRNASAQVLAKLPMIPSQDQELKHQLQSLKAALGDYYAESNDRLGELNGVDFSQYGYETRTKHDC